MHDFQFLTTDELTAMSGDVFIKDVESFPNYFLAAFQHVPTGKIAYFESKNDEPIQGDWLAWMLDRFCTVGFNSNSYDDVILTLAATGRYSVAELKRFTDELIVQRARPYDLLKSENLKPLYCNTIDLFDVAPLTASLKTYAARLHCRHLQDLPFDPNQTLTANEIAITRTYCFHDLENTKLILDELEPFLDLRANLSREFGKDLRSRSDAQLAQEIINTEINRVTGKMPKRVDFTKMIGEHFFYVPPSYVKFNSPVLCQMLDDIKTARIEIGNTGHVFAPPSINGRSVNIGSNIYVIGLGGLHSTEQTQSVTNESCFILDRDVTGYYPNLILKNKFAPVHLADAFLEALQNIVDKRYAAKKSGDKPKADGLKIASNGTFGKLSDPFSTIYSPPMMVQTTITGQLSLLMAIEMLTDAGIAVISANTDGIVSKVLPEQRPLFEQIFKHWEQITSLETEETEYKALYARDVNNYIAIKPDGGFKAKGVYSDKGSALNSPLSKNPQAKITVDAAIACISKGIPIEQTITECKDIRRFVIVKNVTGGSQKDGKYLGKTARWYYAKNTAGAIVYCKSGNKVGMSEGGKPAMILPTLFPDDIDFAKYIEISRCILEDVGFMPRRGEQKILQL